MKDMFWQYKVNLLMKPFQISANNSADVVGKETKEKNIIVNKSYENNTENYKRARSKIK